LSFVAIVARIVSRRRAETNAMEEVTRKIIIILAIKVILINLIIREI